MCLLPAEHLPDDPPDPRLHVCLRQQPPLPHALREQPDQCADGGFGGRDRATVRLPVRRTGARGADAGKGDAVRALHADPHVVFPRAVHARRTLHLPGHDGQRDRSARERANGRVPHGERVCSHRPKVEKGRCRGAESADARAAGAVRRAGRRERRHLGRHPGAAGLLCRGGGQRHRAAAATRKGPG